MLQLSRRLNLPGEGAKPPYALYSPLLLCVESLEGTRCYSISYAQLEVFTSLQGLQSYGEAYGGTAPPRVAGNIGRYADVVT